MKEAWHLCQYSVNLKGDEIEDQQELELRGRIKELIPDRIFLDEEEEYPLHSIITNSEEEYQYTMFSLKHNLYLNLCGFCRKCDFAVGDQVRLSSSSFTIRQNQKNRFTSLSICYNRLMELYRAGRFFLIESENQDRKHFYAEPGNLKIGLTGYRPGSMRYYLLRNAFLHGWTLWDSVKDYLLTFWDSPEKDLPSLYQFFHDMKGVKNELSASQSPSLHAIYDLYMDCIKGSRRKLSDTVNSLKHPLQDGHSMSISEEELREQTIELYKIQRSVILYLGIMHERNEFQNQKWTFPRPLYNFFMSEKELKNK
ncbi:MAG: hypothetical protein B6241_08060 [Spirochaetaceae bacterium 4572_59]|nr:MAG: hypothetical protein B6241_08060 [Spirochaetaceae bacterium 4572_59]